GVLPDHDRRSVLRLLLLCNFGVRSSPTPRAQGWLGWAQRPLYLYQYACIPDLHGSLHEFLGRCGDKRLWVQHVGVQRFSVGTDVFQRDRELDYQQPGHHAGALRDYRRLWVLELA